MSVARSLAPLTRLRLELLTGAKHESAPTREAIRLVLKTFFSLREVVFKDRYINGSEPTVKSILQESNIFSISAIMQFLKEVG